MSSSSRVKPTSRRSSFRDTSGNDSVYSSHNLSFFSSLTFRELYFLLFSLSLLIKSAFIISTRFTSWYSWGYDIELFSRYACNILDGKVPYRDFVIEYPQLAVPVFLMPEILTRYVGMDYYSWYVLLMTSADAFNLYLILIILRLLGKPWNPKKAFFVSIIYACSPLVNYLGIFRYDCVPALIVLLAIYYLLKKKGTISAALLGIGTMVKWYPAVLVPAVLSEGLLTAKTKDTGKRDGFFIRLGLFTAAVLAVLIPSALLFGSGLFKSYTFHFSRPPNTGSVQFLLIYYLGIPVSILQYSFLLITAICFAVLGLHVLKRPKTWLISMFLFLSTFLLFSKVWSIQFGIWLTSIGVIALKDENNLKLLFLYNLAGFLEYPLFPDFYPLVALKWGLCFILYMKLIISNKIIPEVWTDFIAVLRGKQALLYQHS